MGIQIVNPKETDVTKHILEQKDGEGIGVLVEASGNAVVAQTMTDYVAIRGEILMLSVFKHPATVDLRAVNFKEQSIIGTRVYTKMDFKDAITYVSNYEKQIGGCSLTYIFLGERKGCV